MKYAPFLTVILFAFIFSACSSSRITSSWKREGVQQVNFQKIAVIAVIKESDERLRAAMENHLVGDLKDHRYNSFSSFVSYGPKGFYQLDSLAAYNKLLADTVDGVMTIVLLNRKNEKYFVPSRMLQSPYSGDQARFWNYYSTMLERVEGKGYYEDMTRYFWQSNFYDLKKKELIYSVQTESFDPSSTESLGHEYGLMIVKDLVKQKVLAK